MSKANGAVFTATALAAIIGTLAMAFIAKKPFALAPGMGLNTFFVYTVCIAMGHSWQFALTAVFIEGIVFVILTLTNVRKWIVDALPLSLKYAVGAGIGLIIAFLGFQNAGIVGQGPTLVTLAFKLPDGSFSGTALLGILGVIVTGALVMKGVRGGILWGILATTALGLIPMYNVVGADGAVSRVALTSLNGIISVPPSIKDIAFQFTWSELTDAKGILDMIVVLFTFLFLDIFDTMGTVIGVSEKAGYVDKEGNVDGINECFMADSIGTISGAALGTSTTTTYVESAAGVADGGRTGLTAFSTAIFFAIALLFAPIFLAIPCAPQRLLWQLQEHHPHHVGAGDTLCVEIYLHLSRPCERLAIAHITTTIARTHTAAGPPQSLRGSRRRGRVPCTARGARAAIRLEK